MNYNLNSQSAEDKKISTLAGLKGLLNLVSEEKRNLILALFSILLNSTLNLMGPFLIGYTIDKYIQTKQFHGVLLFAGILLVMYLVAFVTSYFQTQLMGGVGQRMIFTLRNAIFNKIGSEVKDAEVLDAFAGSGALGLEALSRGAKKVTFVERDRIAQKIISNNIALLGVEGQSSLIKAPVSGWIKATNKQFDLIFADPPYHDPQLSTVTELFSLLKSNGLMVLSYPGRSETLAETGVVVVDNRSYGTAALAYYRQKDAV